MAETHNTDRFERERDFHNERFGAPQQRKEDSYYAAVRAGMNEYWRLVRQEAPGKDVLEYGCAMGWGSIGLAKSVKHITGIDISDVAIDQARAEAARRGLTNVIFEVDNAEDMKLPTASFDLVFGSGILHHLALEVSLKEIRRVLRPGGKAIFFEPLGHNPVIKLYRSRTPESRTVDEHPLLKSDFDIVRKYFSKCEPQFFGLSSLVSIPFRSSSVGKLIRNAGERLDKVLLRIPGLKWQAWIVVFVLEA